jgi:hypothetical protein
MRYERGSLLSLALGSIEIDGSQTMPIGAVVGLVFSFGIELQRGDWFHGRLYTLEVVEKNPNKI